MMKFIFWTIVFYLLFRFIFNFLIPMIRVGRQMKRQMKAFHKAASGMKQEPEMNTENREQPRPRSTAKKEDYIDFEEIK